MGAYVANEVVRLMVCKGVNPVCARILVLGLAFKENCPDLRNTRVVDIIDTLRGYNASVDVYDPWVDATEADHEYGLIPVSEVEEGYYDAIVLAVGHRQFMNLGPKGIRAFGKANCVIYDVKSVLPREAVDARL
jgi:UDP-N-acetyl-D-galactosamine dehydrogenase